MAITVWKKYSSLKEPDAKSSVWRAPRENEHFLNTSSPEDLFMDPEDFDVLPTAVQDGQNDWRKESNPPNAHWYTFSAPFYTIEGQNYWKKESNPPDAHWYTFSAPLSEFYVTEIF